MRLIVVLLIGAVMGVACGGSQPPAAPGSASGAPPGEIPAPADAELHGAPPPYDEELQELYDISRDLQAVARSESAAVDDLAEDLSRFSEPGKTVDPKTLATSIGRALQGRQLDEASARRVAVLLYVAMNAEKITPAQRAAAAAQLRETLAAAGADREVADAVASQVR